MPRVSVARQQGQGGVTDAQLKRAALKQVTGHTCQCDDCRAARALLESLAK